MPGDDGPGLARDFALADAAVREAGALARAYFEAEPKSWNKADSSPVTEADHAVDRLLRHRLAGRRSGYGWISEESDDDPDRRDRDRVWIVDPIDGTRAFLKGRDTWVICVALAVAGRPVLGFVFNPVRGEFFAALKGRGATLNDQPISVGVRHEIAGCRMLANPRRFVPERWTVPWPDMEVRRISSSAYQVGLVASGRADATAAFTRIREWDLAAADIILTEAGGVITEPDGTPLRYNRPDLSYSGAVAANPVLHAALVDFMAHNRHTPASGQHRRG